MLIEEVFILNARGDVLLRQRHGNPPTNIDDPSELCEMVYHKVVARPSAEPTLRIRGTAGMTVAVVRRNNVFFCGSFRESSSSEDIEVAEVERFDWLERLCSDITGLIGHIDEISVLQNKVLLSEVLDELLFRGWPVCESIASLPRNTLLSSSPAPPPESSFSSLSLLTHKPTEPQGEYLIVEVMDTLHLHMDSLSRKISHCGEGRVSVLMNEGSYHDVEMALEWSRQIFPANTVASFNNCSFHKDIDIPHFDKHKKLKCKLALHQTTLLHYTVPADALMGPIQLQTSLRRHRTLDMNYDLFIILKSNFSSQLQAENIKLRLLVPETTLDIRCDSTSPDTLSRGFMYHSRRLEVVHDGISLQGGQDAHIRYKLRLSSPLDAVSDVGPLFFSYSITGLNLAGLRVSSIVLGSDWTARSLSSDLLTSQSSKRVHREVRYSTHVNEMHSYV